MKFNRNINISERQISDTSPVFIIAEAGVNHNGKLDNALKLIDAAKDAGADAVKFQHFHTENLILRHVGKTPYQKRSTGSAENQFEMLKKLEISTDFTRKLIAHCRKRKIIFLTTPFDELSLEQLNEFDLPAYKVASTDLTNLPFLKKIAAKGKPVILSTGMSYMPEVEAALQTVHPLNKNLILLHCTANYPIRDDEVNLNIISTYKENFDVLTGFSDHSRGVGASPYAVALGARLIEKHFTLNRQMKGPDHKASLTPRELKELVREIRKVEQYMGASEKQPTDSEKQTRIFLQKCLVAATRIQKGEPFTESNLTAKRTGGKGISPIHYKKIMGRKASKTYAPDEIITETF